MLRQDQLSFLTLNSSLAFFRLEFLYIQECPDVSSWIMISASSITGGEDRKAKRWIIISTFPSPFSSDVGTEVWFSSPGLAVWHALFIKSRLWFFSWKSSDKDHRQNLGPENCLAWDLLFFLKCRLHSHSPNKSSSAVMGMSREGAVMWLATKWKFVKKTRKFQNFTNLENESENNSVWFRMSGIIYDTSSERCLI